MSQMTRFSTLFLLASLLLPSGALFAQHSYTAADIEDGGRLYRVHCVNCHGPDGNALANADLSKGKLRHAPNGTESELITIMEKGIQGTAMPPNESFNDFQAATIVAYLHS